MDDIEIHQAAHILVRQHGDGALSKAAERAAELAVQGEQRGALVSKRIVAAVRELQRRERAEGEPLN